MKTVYNMEENNRATGRTTRLIQYYIDQLYTTDKPVVIYDHFDSIHAHKHLTNLIVKRFNNELNRGHKILTKIGANILQLTDK